MKTAFAVFAEQVECQLVECVGDLDARWPRILLGHDVRGCLDSRRPRPDCRGSLWAPDPLRSMVDVARDAVYGRLERLWEARWAINGSPFADDAATSLLLARNVLLVADAVAVVERFYTGAERRAVVAAGIAEIRGDDAGVAAARDGLARAAADALRALDDGTAPVAPGPLDLVRAEIMARLRGEAGGTDAHAVRELTWLLRWWADVSPDDDFRYGPLCEVRPDKPNDVEGRELCELRGDVWHQFSRLWMARLKAGDALRKQMPWRATVAEIGAGLVVLLNVVLAAEGVNVVEQQYVEVERRAMAVAAVAQIRGDEDGIATQRDVLRETAAAVMRETEAASRNAEVNVVPALQDCFDSVGSGDAREWLRNLGFNTDGLPPPPIKTKAA